MALFTRLKKNDLRWTFSFTLEAIYLWPILLSHRESPNPDCSAAKPITQSLYQLRCLLPSVRFNVTNRGLGGDLRHGSKYSFKRATVFFLMSADNKTIYPLHKYKFSKKNWVPLYLKKHYTMKSKGERTEKHRHTHSSTHNSAVGQQVASFMPLLLYTPRTEPQYALDRRSCNISKREEG